MTMWYEYWTSVKIKIDMTCVSKEYEIKTKMEQEQWLVGGNKNMVGGVYWGGNFSRWGDEQILGGGGNLPIPPVGKTLPCNP